MRQRRSVSRLGINPLLALTLHRNKSYLEEEIKAAPGFEPGVEILQTSALPLGYAAVSSVIKYIKYWGVHPFFLLKITLILAKALRL